MSGAYDDPAVQAAIREHTLQSPTETSEGLIPLASVYYRTDTHRVVISPDPQFGMADDFEPAEMFGQESKEHLGASIQSLAQILPGNEIVVAVYNAVHAALGAIEQDESVREHGAYSAAMSLLDREALDR